MIAAAEQRAFEAEACPNIVHARCPKGSYMCPDTSAGTLAIAAAPAPHFVCAVQSALDRSPYLILMPPRFMLAIKTTYVALSRCGLRFPHGGVIVWSLLSCE